MHIAQTVSAAIIVVAIDPAPVVSLHAQQKIDAAFPQLLFGIDTRRCGAANRLDSRRPRLGGNTPVDFETAKERADPLSLGGRFPR